MLPYDTATFATAQAGSTSGRMAASWRRRVLTLAATSGHPLRPKSRRANDWSQSTADAARRPSAVTNFPKQPFSALRRQSASKARRVSAGRRIELALPASAVVGVERTIPSQRLFALCARRAHQAGGRDDGHSPGADGGQLHRVPLLRRLAAGCLHCLCLDMLSNVHACNSRHRAQGLARVIGGKPREQIQRDPASNCSMACTTSNRCSSRPWAPHSLRSVPKKSPP